MASFIMVKLTPNTTPKNPSNMISTRRPVNGFGETDDVGIVKLLRFDNVAGKLRAHEIVGGGGNLAKPDVGDVEPHRNGFLGVAVGRRGDEHPELGGLVAP